jgi:hypothetical protein
MRRILLKMARGFFLFLAFSFCFDMQAQPFAADLPPKLPQNWGGEDWVMWRPEAIMANGFSELLNRYWQPHEVAEVIVAIPTKFYDSFHHPYGDRQSNALVSFHDWHQFKTSAFPLRYGLDAFRPPLMAAFVRHADGRRDVYFQFDRRFPKGTKELIGFEVRYIDTEDNVNIIKLNASRDHGHLVGIWKDVPIESSIHGRSDDVAFFVKPIDSMDDGHQTFRDLFPISFRIDTAPIEVLARELVPLPGCAHNVDCNGLTLSLEDQALTSIKWLDVEDDDPDLGKMKSRLLENIERLMSAHQSDGLSRDRLGSLRQAYYEILNEGKASVLKKALFFVDNWTTNYNASRNGLPYFPLDIYGRFPTQQGDITTATGMGWSWVYQKSGPLKAVYSCFERRRPAEESEVNRGSSSNFKEGRTVPSGSGWHRIGDQRVSLLNSLEQRAILVGAGYSTPTANLKSLGPKEGESYVYGLTDVAVGRLLFPGEAFLNHGSPKSSSDLMTVQPPVNRYSWYLMPHDYEFCAEQWFETQR